jgi:hypothetical protein
MDSRMIERKNRLLQELSYILMELEEISAAQEMEEKSTDFTITPEHSCQIEIPSDKEHAFKHESKEFFACLTPVCSEECEDQIFEKFTMHDRRRCAR